MRIEYGQTAFIQGRVGEPKYQEQERIKKLFTRIGLEKPAFIDALEQNIRDFVTTNEITTLIFGGSADIQTLNRKNIENDDLARLYYHNTEEIVRITLGGSESIQAFGICLGHQLTAQVAHTLYTPGRDILERKEEESGTFLFFVQEEERTNPLFKHVVNQKEGVSVDKIRMVFGHKYFVTELPFRRCKTLGYTERDRFSAFNYTDNSGKIIAVTFAGHPEILGKEAEKIGEAGGYRSDKFGPSDMTENLIRNFCSSRRTAKNA